MNQPYDVIPHEENPLLKYFGDACVAFDTYPYYFMTQMCGDAYQGGLWEFRRYPNGAVCMVFPDQKQITPVTFNGNMVECSLEAVSYAVWLIVLSSVSMEMNEKGKDDIATTIHDHYHGLLDMLSGRIRFMINEIIGGDCRDLTPEEEEMIVPRLQKHPELSAIGSIID
ncbi:Antirestriction protein [Ectopseudomonas mendocina]|uniref:Antirestriction protein n=1 Tax=Ectopseudomonas mendocina TaxID=300 RepID=A0A379PLP1_ECTME|nr:antirestriction protein [Pseudomonas mendocina]SUE95891.1 Antirestriction protein [Pseudomonas mendocina]